MGGAATIDRARASLRHHTAGEQEKSIETVASASILTTAKNVLTEASLFEPEILLTDKLIDVGRLPIADGIARNPTIDAWTRLFHSLKAEYKYLVFVPHLMRGGADLVAVNAIRAACERHGTGSTLLVLTDSGQKEALDWLPPSARTHITVISDIAQSLDIQGRSRLIEMLVMALKPRAILNVNSGACWDALKRSGAWLASVTDVYVSLFCRDYLDDGRAAGYTDTHVRPCLPYIKGVYCDNSQLPTWLSTYYGLPPSQRAKLIVQLQPKSPLATPRGFLRTRNDARLPILWAGRFCRQKNIDLLIDIATICDRFHFHVYGYGDERHLKKMAAAEKRLPNFTLKGPFTSTESLPTENYAALLYTSLWDGLPLIINSAAALGLPVVASDVGGISQLVDDDTGWLVRDYANPGGYVDALNDILRYPDKAALRVERMVKRVQNQHSWRSYEETFKQSPSFLD